MSATLLPQLQQIEEELAQQEKVLSAQLQEVRNKLEGVRAVLPMFGEQSEEATAPATPSVEAKVPAVEEQPQSTKAKRKASKGKKKKDGRAADWQKYARPGVKNQSIPEAVQLVLATQPDKEFKIAEVMEALFRDMPKAQYVKARNRVSNVLSGGVRAGDWHKGEKSTYRMNAA